MATIDVGDHPTGMAITGGSVWVANFEDDNVQRIDIATNRVIATIPVGDGPELPAHGQKCLGPQLARRHGLSNQTRERIAWSGSRSGSGRRWIA